MAGADLRVEDTTTRLEGMVTTVCRSPQHQNWMRMMVTSESEGSTVVDFPVRTGAPRMEDMEFLPYMHALKGQQVKYVHRQGEGFDNEYRIEILTGTLKGTTFRHYDRE